MVVIPDLSVAALQTLPFLVAFLGLYVILWKPLLDYLQEREDATEGARHDAAHLADEVSTKVAELEGRLASARGDVAKERAEARARAAKQESAIIADARKAADAKVTSATAEIAQARTAAAAQVKGMAGSLVDDITRSVLGRSANA